MQPEVLTEVWKRLRGTTGLLDGVTTFFGVPTAVVFEVHVKGDGSGPDRGVRLFPSHGRSTGERVHNEERGGSVSLLCCCRAGCS